MTMDIFRLPLVLLLMSLSGFTLSDNATTKGPEGTPATKYITQASDTAEPTSGTAVNATSALESVTDTTLTTGTSATELNTMFSDGSHSSYSAVPNPTGTLMESIGADVLTILTTDLDLLNTAEIVTVSDPGRSSPTLTAGLGEATGMGSTSLPPTATIDQEGLTSETGTANNSGAIATDRSDDSNSNQISSPSTNPGVGRAATGKENFTTTLKMSGTCETIGNGSIFMEELRENLVEHFEGKEFKFYPVGVKCGSIIIKLMVEMERADKERFQIYSNFTFTYNSTVYEAVGFSFEGGGRLPTTTPIADNDSSSKSQNPLQETLVYIVIGSVGGSFILLSLFLLCQYLAHKAIKTSGKNSFRPRSNEPSIKLSDFNMAHTYIPRPQSIYSATTRSSFLPYEDMDPGSNGGVASPGPYVYADSDQIREHYHEVVERGDPVTPTSKTIHDFGKSGIPSWDLPVLEGVVQEEDSASTLRMDDRPTSSTFHAPPEGIPPPPDSSPPSPPGDSLPGLQQQREEGTTSLKSEEGSNHTELSGGDTRHLIRPQNHDVGVDNPALDIDNAYF